MGERMPLFSRVVKVNQDGELQPIVIDSEVDWMVTTIEGSGAVAEAEHWRDVWHESLPEEPGHTEWWYTGTLAGLGEGKVKLQARIAYFTSGENPELVFLSGPEHEVEVHGFVDLWIGGVDEWGEEDPGVFMPEGTVESHILRTCTAGDVVLSWNSDKVGYYEDAECENPVDEDECSAEGSRRATFTTYQPVFPDVDRWGARFYWNCVYAKALEASEMRRDIRVTLSPVSGKSVPDVVNLTVFTGVQLKEVTFSGDKFHDVERDLDGSGLYQPPHWQDNSQPLDGDADDPGDHKYPVCYTRNAKMRLSATMVVEPADLFGGSVQIRGDDWGGFDIPVRAASVQGDLLSLTNVECPQKLANAVDIFDANNPFDIVWKLSPNNGVNWFSVGVSRNVLYVVLDDPTGHTYDKVLDFSCSWAKTKNDPQEVFDAVWDKIDDLNATGYKYWGPDADGKLTILDLIRNQDGTCQAWGEFFQGLCVAHGIPVSLEEVTPKLPTYYGLIVKNKDFGPKRYPPPFEYDKDELIDKPGIKGQGDVTPTTKLFVNHAINKFGGKIYDPSYGRGPFNDLHAWEEDAIRAYGEQATGGQRVKPNDPGETEVQ